MPTMQRDAMVLHSWGDSVQDSCDCLVGEQARLNFGLSALVFKKRTMQTEKCFYPMLDHVYTTMTTADRSD